jgi:aryl-alcohol dehydrogenase-like predicted oxidoreductase
MTAPWQQVTLGATGLRVVPLGLAASYGAGAADVEYAFERGVDFFYWGSARTKSFGEGLRRIGRTARDRLTLVVQTYRRSPKALEPSLDRALRDLRFDHADVLLLGWWNLPPADAILDAAADVVRRGKARAVMISCHHRPSFARLARDPRVGLLMLRYNAAHPGAERDVFPSLPTPRPGVVSYTATSWGQLLDRKLVPTGEECPRASDCYRFVLAQPFVDACWCGPKNRAELDEALRALGDGPLDEERMAWLRRVGAAVRERTQTRSRGMGLVERFVNLASGFGFRTAQGLDEP